MKTPHHFATRERDARGREPYPARDAWTRTLDRVVLTVGIVGPFTVLPQIIKIFSMHSAAGVSVLSWALPAVLDTPWVVYGIVHHERPIFITYLLWIFANILVVVGVVIYGTGPL